MNVGAALRTDLVVGPFTVHLPDASDPTFWLMHDLAGLFGIEENGEAAKRLKKALRDRKLRIDVDHESDFVFVHAKSARAMMATLGVLEQIAPGTLRGVDLDGVLAVLAAHRRPKPKAYDVGDVFAVSLGGEGFGAIQVMSFPDASERFRGSPIALALDLATPDLDSLRARLEAGEGRPLAARQILDVEIVSGMWPRLLSRPLPPVDVAKLTTRERGRSGPIQTILGACLGFEPWEQFEPHPHERYLLDGVTPPRKRHRRTVFERRVLEVLGGARPACEEGPATLHVLVAYRGHSKEVPNLELPKLTTLYREMGAHAPPDLPHEERCLGGGFDGYLDLFLRTADVARALAHLDRVATSLGVTNDMLVERFPPFAFDWRGTCARMGLW